MKLTAEQVIDIRKRLRDGESVNAILIDFPGVTYWCIREIRDCRRWKSISQQKEHEMTNENVEQTKFSKWLKDFGIQNLVSAMREKGPDYAITISAAYQWARREHEPRPKKARALIEISRGAITLQDIADHFEAIG